MNLYIRETGITEFPDELKTGKIIKRIILADKLTPDADNSDNIFQK
jgi:hypothetical protein